MFIPHFLEDAIVGLFFMARLQVTIFVWLDFGSGFFLKDIVVEPRCARLLRECV